MSVIVIIRDCIDCNVIITDVIGKLFRMMKLLSVMKISCVFFCVCLCMCECIIQHGLADHALDSCSSAFTLPERACSSL